MRFLQQSPSGAAVTKSVQATLQDLGNRIDGLVELSSKGVHDVVSREEVEWCVIQTYLLAGEVLRLRQRGR